MHVRLIIPLVLLLGVALPDQLQGTRKLILDLNDVIGEPPPKDTSTTARKPDMFYTLGQSVMDPKMEELWQQKRMGLPLTGDDQAYFDHYLQHGNSPGKANRFIKQIYPEALRWDEKRIRASFGDYCSFIYCYPNAKGTFPVALVLDPEIAAQEEAGREDFQRVIVRLSAEQELPYDESYRGRYITHNPIGNQLMAHGIAVIIPTGDTLNRLAMMTQADWQEALDLVMKHNSIDRESLFLVSTKEFASQAIETAGGYPFKGLIVEEPESGMFGLTTPDNPDDSMKMAELQSNYKAVLEALTCPLLVLRNKKNSLLDINDELLLRPIIEWQRPLYLSMTNFPIRILEPEKVEEGIRTPEQFAYFSSTMEKTSNRILYFVQQHGESGLSQMPEVSDVVRLDQRTSSAATNMINIFDAQTRRLRQLMQNATGNSELGNDLLNDSGGDPFGNDFDDGGGGDFDPGNQEGF